MLQVDEINAIEHLEAIRLRWTSLLNETRGGSFFHTLDWLKIYWRHFRDGQRLRVLLVYRGGSVLGILPLVVRQEVTAANPIDVLTYPMVHPNQFFGPVGPNPTATLMAAFRYFTSQSRDWDMLSLAGIGEHDCGRTANALELAGFCPHETVPANVSKICFDASWPEYLSGREAGVAERLNMLDRETEIRGNLRFERVRPLAGSYGDDQPLEDLIDECFQLDWHSPSARPPAETSAAFLRDVVTTASRLGMLDLNLLRMDGRLIAFSLNVHFDGAIQQLWVGQNAESLNFQPASMLTLRMLRDSFARKDRFLYLEQSHDEFAKLWATRQFPVVSYQHRATSQVRTRLARLDSWLRSR